MIRRLEAKTFTLRVPEQDWTRLIAGQCSEFRTVPVGRPRDGHDSVVNRSNNGTLVVLYREKDEGEPDSELMALEERRREPLFALADDPEAVDRAGFESYQAFRRWWRQHHDGDYVPLTKVDVWRVRPVTPDDVAAAADRLVRHLYGPWLEELERNGNLQPGIILR